MNEITNDYFLFFSCCKRNQRNQRNQLIQPGNLINQSTNLARQPNRKGTALVWVTGDDDIPPVGAGNRPGET
jgi:hypothetical protein